MSTMIKQTPSVGEIPFGEYAAVYDLIYQDKDYPGEALFVARLLDRCLGKPTEQTGAMRIARHAQSEEQGLDGVDR